VSSLCVASSFSLSFVFKSRFNLSSFLGKNQPLVKILREELHYSLILFPSLSFVLEIMRTSLPRLFAVAINVISLTAIAALLFSANIETGSAQQGEPQVETDGGLTATLNGDSFTTGDIITVIGSVEVRGPYSEALIHVIDPEGKTVELVHVTVVSAGEFTQFYHSFVAGENEGTPDDEEPMVTSGSYQMVVQFGPESVEFIFGYTATSGATTGATTTEATTSDNITSSAGTLNVTAINQLTAQAITHTEQAYIAMQNNDTQGVFRNLNLALNELESLQGNLTLTASDGSNSSSNIGNNTMAETTTGAVTSGSSSRSGNGGNSANYLTFP
jgi:hypothetical protein